MKMQGVKRKPGIDETVDTIRRNSRSAAFIYTLVSLTCLASLVFSGTFDLHRYADAVPTFLTLMNDAFPPDFSGWHRWGGPLAETMAMGISGTVLAALGALPLALLAATNTTPSRKLIAPIRIFFNICRSVPDVILGAVMVAIVGFGTLPGVLALSIHSLGMLGKFYAEIIERGDPAPVDVLISQSATRLQTIRFAVLPDAMPRLLDVTLYRWEHNIRAAMLMGIVGAGGLGLELVMALKLFEYREALSLLMLMVLLTTSVDLLSMMLRHRNGGAR